MNLGQDTLRNIQKKNCWLQSLSTNGHSSSIRNSRKGRMRWCNVILEDERVIEEQWHVDWGLSSCAAMKTFVKGDGGWRWESEFERFDTKMFQKGRYE